MALFDAKNFNGEVFGAYVDQIDNLNRNELLNSRALVEKPQYASMLPDQTGGNYITVPIKARLSGNADNYDGNTDINESERKTYTQGRIVVGRAHAFTEKDFTVDITGEDFLPAVAEIAEYWDDIDQNTLLATLKGVFSMTGTKNLEFVNNHTYDISGNASSNMFDEVTLNGDYRVYIWAPDASNTWVYSTQKKTDGKYNGTYYVRADGYMYCSNANISGTVNATSGTFQGTVISI